ncbi:MAG: cytochrome c oxidase subunit II [Acidobacteriia bacterium]|nr:cytochrome c oxidase subunit II [Terriglobia bacterium]
MRNERGNRKDGITMQGIAIHPEQASTIAPSVDYLFSFLTAAALFFTVLMFLIIFYFMIKYRRRSPVDRAKAIEGTLPLEILWIAIPTVIVAVIFVWGSRLYLRNAEPPPGSMEVFVTGRQWMWKVEHPEGQREINELHVPVGRPVKLTMTSEDGIHSFYVPAFRVQKNVLPGQYTSLWFEPTKVGTFHFFCGQYCGAFHAGMTGSVIVVKPDEYAQWLTGVVPGETVAAAGAPGAVMAPAGVQGGTTAAAGAQGGSAVAGEKQFQQSGCPVCHLDNGKGLGPSFVGLYGNPVHLTNGQTVTADDAFIRECILTPDVRRVAGYPPLMASFQGQLSDEQVLNVIAYIRSLGAKPGKPPEKEGAGVPGGGATAPAGAQGGTAAAGAQGGTAAGEKLFQQHGCPVCHPAAGKGLGPSLAGVYGHPVQLTNGQTVTADDAYIRECILTPDVRRVAGYPPLMASFQGQLSEEELLDVIAYIRSLGAGPGKPPEKEGAGVPGGAATVPAGAQGGTTAPAGAPGGTAAAGEKVFQQRGCPVCHPAAGKGLGPSLAGVYGHPVQLTNGQTVTADDAFIRECILTPDVRRVAGYPPLMASFQGQLSEEELLDVIAYIRSLGAEPGKPPEKEEEKK